MLSCSLSLRDDFSFRSIKAAGLMVPLMIYTAFMALPFPEMVNLLLLLLSLIKCNDHGSMAVLQEGYDVVHL